jgi:hypothetical protein
VEVPPSATGTVRVSLTGVEIKDNLGHGVLVNDQEDSSAPDGVQPNANGSAVDVDLRADQQTPGSGKLVVSNLTYATNGGNVPATPVP